MEGVYVRCGRIFFFLQVYLVQLCLANIDTYQSRHGQKSK